MERFSRQVILPEIGEEGQRKLARAAVLVVGIGGLGSPVCQYLTCAGVGRLGLCDSDTVSESNLNRQTLYGENVVGQQKTAAASRRLREMSSQTALDLWPDGLTEENAAEIVGRYDLVVDCCDNHATRYLIDDSCRRANKTWVYGSVGEFEGRVSTFGPQGLSYSDLFPDRDALASLPPSSGGIIGAMPGIVGAIEAAEVIKLICGFGETLEGKLLTINLKELNFNIFEL